MCILGFPTSKPPDENHFFHTAFPLKTDAKKQFFSMSSWPSLWASLSQLESAKPFDSSSKGKSSRVQSHSWVESCWCCLGEPSLGSSSKFLVSSISSGASPALPHLIFPFSFGIHTRMCMFPVDLSLLEVKILSPTLWFDFLWCCLFHVMQLRFLSGHDKCFHTFPLQLYRFKIIYSVSLAKRFRIGILQQYFFGLDAHRHYIFVSSDFFPVVLAFCRRLPVIGTILNLPAIRNVR
jgi:hypothetical protein